MTERDQSTTRVGLWLIGARGAISTCVAYGLAGLELELCEPLGIATLRDPEISRLPCLPTSALVLGGHDVCSRGLSRCAGELVQSHVLPADLVAAAAEYAAAFESSIRPGILDAHDVGLADLVPLSAQRGALAPREQIACLIQDWEEFEKRGDLARTVVVYVASTEADREAQPVWNTLEAFEQALDAGTSQPASMLYAYAALSSGRPFVNFTPSVGASTPALQELALKHGVPHCGNDGKTGETLLKTALAPMFRARALRVLSWQGYNMLGNRDGEVLRDEAHKQAKVRNKDEALRSILGADEELHTEVGIDFVPSLSDWKTAWDFVHFEGFLGTRMSLQFTWAGSDSALAAPLVIDLVRLVDLAAQRGEKGALDHTACYFKAPLGGGTHDFHQQYSRLVDYARRVSS